MLDPNCFSECHWALTIISLIIWKLISLEGTSLILIKSLKINCRGTCRYRFFFPCKLLIYFAFRIMSENQSLSFFQGWSYLKLEEKVTKNAKQNRSFIFYVLFFSLFKIHQFFKSFFNHFFLIFELLIKCYLFFNLCFILYS